MSTKKVVVVGATGELGNKIVKALLAQGAEVTAMVRATSNRSALEKMGVTHFVVGDMMNKDSLKEALSPKYNFDAIVSSAAGYTGHTKGDSPKTDTIGYRNLVDAAKDAGIQRFVLISILECDKAAKVPHFYNKYMIEQYLREKKQPFIALRAGVFLDQTRDFILPQIPKGILPVFFPSGDYGIIYTGDLARYVAIAATTLPDSELNTTVDVGWSTPVNKQILAAAFEKVLNKPVTIKPAIPPFVMNIVLPLFGKIFARIADLTEMVKWVKTGAYVSKNPQRQKQLFGDLPTPEEGVRHYCTDKNLIGG